MTKTELQIGRIDAVLYAAEELLKRTNDKETRQMAKETAYDHIKGILDDPDWFPWKGDNE